MSLYRQLWIAIAALMLLVFGTTFLINGFSSSRYLGERLSIKNNDDASALALSLSQQQLDTLGLELQLAAQLDQGSYTLIRLTDPEGAVAFERRQSFEAEAAPAWLRGLFPIESLPGSASVTNGWSQLGTLTLRSHDGYAYGELWTMGKNTLLALIIAIALAGAVASWLLKHILRPLDGVVRQAEALGDRRFEKQPVPSSLEMAVVTRAMNALTDRVRFMLEEESERLSVQRQRVEADAVTGLLSREPFMERMLGKLQDESEESAGSIAILRIEDLMGLNQEFGRAVIDTVLKEIGASLQGWASKRGELLVGRLNGSDVIVMAPGEDEAQFLGDMLRQRVTNVLAEHTLLAQIRVPTACGPYESGDQPGDLLGKLDQAMSLDSGDRHRPATLMATSDSDGGSARSLKETWEARLSAALSSNDFSLAFFPVVSAAGTLLHNEGMLRLACDGRSYSGGEVLPWARRLGRGSDVDRAVLRLAIAQCADSDEPVCINLSADALTDPSFRFNLEDALQAAPMARDQLHLDIAEAAAFDHAEAFVALRSVAHAHGVRLGMEHMGYRLADLGLLGELGPDYLKIDRAFVTGIDSNTARRTLLTTYASIARSMGINCIAEGVSSAQERDAAIECGASGVTGPGVHLA